MIVPASVAWRTLISWEPGVVIFTGSEKRKKLEERASGVSKENPRVSPLPSLRLEDLRLL
jgi:hypothetical protein